MISTVVVGVDSSSRSARVLDAASEVAAAIGSQLHVVTAFVDGSAGGLEITRERRAAEQLLDRHVNATRLASRVEKHALPEKPADAILRIASEFNADLVVVGNRRAQGTQRVLGSVASDVVAHAPCNVLVVKTS
jgi:nucleotide-binding universal stress UspA family protein